MAENPFDILGSMEEDMPPMEQPAMAPTEMEQKANFDRFDAPMPGQSLTDKPGNALYEQPPQYTSLDKFMEYMFTSMNSSSTRRDILRLLDAGVPVQLLLEPLILHAINEGKINIDLGMLAVQPLATIIYGMGLAAGINVVTDDGQEEVGLDPRPFEKAFKKKRVDTTPPKLPETKSNLVARRKM